MEMTRWATVGVAMLVPLTLAPIWAAYGALAPGGDHGEMGVNMERFQAASEAYVAEHRLEDGSVYAVPETPIPVLSMQYGFQPNVLRMRAGRTYHLQFASRDVAHGFSLQLGAGSWNIMIMPGSMAMLEVQPNRPGEYLFLCNEYCGIGHQFMSGKIIVESGDGTPVPGGVHGGH